MAELKLIPVKNNISLGRDPNSKAIVSTDMKAVEDARARKAALNRRKEKEKSLEQRMEKLENSVDQMTGLLQNILKKLS